MHRLRKSDPLTPCGPSAGCVSPAPAGTLLKQAKSAGSRRAAPQRSGRTAGIGRRT